MSLIDPQKVEAALQAELNRGASYEAAARIVITRAEFGHLEVMKALKRIIGAEGQNAVRIVVRAADVTYESTVEPNIKNQGA